ncbi:unnamed protein product [Calypogeia fissa]
MSSSTQQVSNNHHNQFSSRLHHQAPTEADVCTWLRDEPMDISAASSFLHSGAVGRNFIGSSSGSGGAELNNVEISGGLRGCVVDGSSSPRYLSDLTTEEGAQRKDLLAQLRATKIKESVLLEGIQRLGGGQKGLRGVIRAIMFWLEARHRHCSQSSEPSNMSQSEFLSPRLDEIDQFSLSNLDCGSVVDCAGGGQVGGQYFGSLQHHNQGNLSHSSPTDLSGLVSSSSSCPDNDDSLCDLKSEHGSGEYGQVTPNNESRQQQQQAQAQAQPHVFIGEPDRMVGGGLQSQQSSGAAARKDMSPGDWVPPMREYDAIRQEKSHRAKMIRKLSPSPDRSGVHSAHDLVSYDDTLSHEQQSKIRRHSPISAGYSSSHSSTSEFSSNVSSTAEVLGTQGIFGAVGSNPFAPGGPFNISPSSPPTTDPHSLDFNAAFGTHGHILMDDALGTLGSTIHGCGLIDRLGSVGYPLSPENSVDRKQPQSGTRLGASVVGKTKGGSPAASTRLARKQRMDRNRKGSLYQVNRGAFETNTLLAGKSGGGCSPGSLRSICRSQGRPAAEGPTCKTIDRKDQENLQFLLMKVLRPSDVGNLGRIVLPKKDAESHLPWLCAREGIQFACEDYDTGELMTLRYRFWPNNKSRMYLLENTGDFIKKHRLQESDRMLMYRNQQQGTYIIRARKAQDCVESLPRLGRSDDMEGDTKEICEQSSPGGTCSSGTSSLSGTESTLGSAHDGTSESCVPVAAIVTSQDDMLNFADLPDAPMGDGTENLVRFPSLESFDVELLELAPSGAAKEEDVTSCAVKKEE